MKGQGNEVNGGKQSHLIFDTLFYWKSVKVCMCLRTSGLKGTEMLMLLNEEAYCSGFFKAMFEIYIDRNPVVTSFGPKP